MKETSDKYNDLAVVAKKHEAEFLQFLKKNKNRLAKMDTIVQSLHDQHTESIDCLSCANCCKVLGPAIFDKDIERMAKALKMKPSKVVETYLRVDEDGDYVFKTMPCPFLMSDNYCSIYDSRPKACREYPHTDRRNFVQIYKLTVKNAHTCPIAYEVLKEVITK